MEKQNKKVIIIGSGFGGLSSACLLAKKGFDVTVYEKNQYHGGRANILKEKGFVFDMGPSWYMMPDVFEHFFSLLGERVEDYLQLERLDPSYRIFVEGDRTHYDVFSDRKKMYDFFESREVGAGQKLIDHLDNSAYQYDVAKREFMYKNYDSLFDLLNKRMLTEGRKMPLLKNMKQLITGLFKDELLQHILQYQTVFLGTAPKDTPGIYSLMNHVDIDGGIWYPQGGLYKLVEAFVSIAEKNGATFYNNSPVDTIVIEHGITKGVILANGDFQEADIVISNADIAYTDMHMTPKPYRLHTERWWNKKKLTPSAFLLYVGVEGSIESLTHHNLLLTKDWEQNMSEVFDTRDWPENPSLYICAPSKSDKTVAPTGSENLFILVPTAYDITATDEFLEKYSDKIISYIEKELELPDLQKRITYKKTYAITDFEKDYNAYKGNALGGLAHTLAQTAFFRPNNINKKAVGLYYVGAGTNPGIGVPICVISGELVYKRILNISDPEPLQEL